MSQFDYSCPKCSHSGDSTSLSCWNCSGPIERVKISENYEQIQCTRCGISQTPPCPKCGALITFQRTSNKTSVLGGIIALVVLFLIFKGCSGSSDTPTKSHSSNAVTPSAQSSSSPPPVSQPTEPKPKWIIKD